ncbi:hypothetical protein JCM10295v2_001371 [Rhodotorula toruloides]
MSSVFGYGSLIWKGPPFDLESTPGYIKGFVRRFAQASHDHRGTPEKPVVTLVTEEDWEEHRKDDPLGTHHVWGRVYRIPKERSSEIWAYLDHREKDGYTLRTVDVFGVDEGGKEIIVEEGVRVYVGETHNPSFAGGMPMAELAEHIARSVGPSGANKDYVYNLANAVRQLCPASEDAYLKELERLVRERDPDHSVLTSRLRSSSKKRLSSLFSRSNTLSLGSSQTKQMSAFLHVKFGSGRPPEHAHQLPFAHEIEEDPTRTALHDSLKTDVQRSGVIRYLEQNFKDGSYVHDVVSSRETDHGMYALICKNWARSVGDHKLHLSLYIYQDDRHVATWHAYTDRSISYSRSGDETDPPTNDAGADPYSTAEALEAATSRAPTPAPASPDADRPRFNRPAAAPDSDTDGVETPFETSGLSSKPASPTSAEGKDVRSPVKQTGRGRHDQESESSLTIRKAASPAHESTSPDIKRANSPDRPVEASPTPVDLVRRRSCRRQGLPYRRIEADWANADSPFATTPLFSTGAVNKPPTRLWSPFGSVAVCRRKQIAAQSLAYHQGRPRGPGATFFSPPSFTFA